MNSSTAPADSPSLEDEVLTSLCAHLRKVADQRSDHGKVHDLHAVLCLIVTSMLVGKFGISTIVSFAMGHGARRRFHGPNRKARSIEAEAVQDEPAQWLYTIGLLWRGRPVVPSVQTIINMLNGIEAADLSEALGQWLVETLDRLGAERLVLSVDGKAMRAADKHILNGFIHDLAQTAFDWEVEEKKNELSSFRDHFDEFLERYPAIWLICGDAMFADRKLCDLIKNNGRDWLVQIKENQGNLYEKLQIAFSPSIHGPAQYSEEAEKKRGQAY